MKRKSAKKIGIKLAALLLLAAGYWLLQASGIGCIYRRLFGVICPGCGMSRAIEALLRLDLAAAWNWHPMVFSLPVLIAYLLKDGPLLRNRKQDALLLILIGAGFLANYVHNWNNTNLFF